MGRGIKGWLIHKMIDLQEVYCSPACLSGVVFTSALVGDCLSCTGVLFCVCVYVCVQLFSHSLNIHSVQETFRINTMTFPQRQKKILLKKKKERDLRGISTLNTNGIQSQIRTKIMHFLLTILARASLLMHIRLSLTCWFCDFFLCVLFACKYV